MTTPKEKLKAIEARLVALEQEKLVLVNQKQRLLEQPHSGDLDVIAHTSILTSQQKVDIFCSLFKGRDDIFATRWQNQQGRSGYSVACNNEWQRGLCNKPKIKCGECSNRAFRPLTNKAIYDHLAGTHTAGLYPLLTNDHCWLLAVDFDKSDWKLAATAFRAACRAWKIPCAVERSRSGNGAHIWIFFDSPIPARDARRLGFSLLDKAMENHAGLSFDSYDRLFPNQDTLPTGGFGNLIALPLQQEPRKSGNSEFIDKHFISYPDQWAFLASLRRTTVKEVYDWLRSAEQTTHEEDADLKPWEVGLPIKVEPIPQ